jgi:hypothetical protein
MRKPAAVLAAALLAASTVAGCSTGSFVAARSLHEPAAATAAEPVPRPALRRLPPGVFYILSAQHLNEMNLWVLTSGGIETQLTHNPPGYEIDAFGASSAGIVVADSLHLADQLARWTSHGPVWLHPAGSRSGYINGAVPDIRADGALTYELPPGDSAGKHMADFTIWAKQSFTGPQRIRYWLRADPGEPLFGPGGQIAVAGPGGPYLAKGQTPAVVFISPGGSLHRFTTPMQGEWLPVWGQSAPAVAVLAWKGPTELVFPSGKRELLPEGWAPLTWDPGGTRLLVLSGTTLGVWSLRDPGTVTVITTITPGFLIEEARWLTSKAPM